jgi:hypothetical protein
MANYYVATTGNDTAEGTINAPLKTLDKGLNKAFAGDRIILRGGTYRNRAGWFPEQQATINDPIRIEAYPGETVNISAFEDLTDWEPFDLTNGRAIYRAPMPFTMCEEDYAVGGEDFLVWNGSVLNEARWPAANINDYPQWTEGWAAVESGQWISDANVEHASVTAQIQDNDLLSFATNSLIGSYITILPGARWTWISGKVVANEGNSLTFETKSPGGSTFYRPDGRSLYFLFGKQEFLSYPGSWWRDSISNTVYVWLPDNSNPGNSIIEAKQAHKLIDFWSRSYYHHINLNYIGGVTHVVNTSGTVFQDCTFKWYSHRLYFPTAWAWLNPAFFDNNNGLTLRNCDFLDAVGPAVTIDGNSNSIIENCTIINTGGLNIGGTNSQVFLNTIWKCPHGPAKIKNNVTNLKVYNNDIGYGGTTIFDEGLLTINRSATGFGAEVYNNYIHDGYGLGDGPKEFYGTAGLYFDDNTAAINFHHNIISNVTSPGLNICGELENVLFVNNIFDLSPGVAWWMYKWYPGCKFINNYTTEFAPGTSVHPDMECVQNAFKEISVPNNIIVPDPRFNPDYSLQFNSALKGAGIVVNGITSTNPPDIGAWEGIRSPVGAVLRNSDLSQLTITSYVVDGDFIIFGIGNLPFGRRLGENFRMKLGSGAEAIGTIIPYDVTTGGTVWARVGVNVESWVAIGQIGTAPILSSLSGSRIQGTVIALLGSGFTTNSFVQLDGVELVTTYIDAGRLEVTIPANATPTNLSLQIFNADGQASGTLALTVLSSLALTSLSASTVQLGQQIQAVGTGFIEGAIASFVSAGVATATTFVSSTSLTLVIPLLPSGVTTLRVINPNGAESGTLQLTVLLPPSIASFGPNPVQRGQILTISGADFGSDPYLLFARQEIIPIAYTSSSLQAIVPAIAAFGATATQVVSAVGASAEISVVVVRTPALTSIAPTAAQPGSTIRVTGTDFEDPVILVNGNSVEFTNVGEGLSFVLPQFPPSNLSVRVRNSTTALSEAIGLMVLPPISIVSLPIPTAAPQAEIVLEGKFFPTNAQVFFGNVQAQIQSLTSNQIIVQVPPELPPIPTSIKITTPDGASSIQTIPFDVLPSLIISRVFPNPAPSGTSIQISGTGFDEGVVVLVRDVLAIDLVRVSDTQLKLTVPQLSPGSAQIKIVLPDDRQTVFDFSVPTVWISGVSHTVVQVGEWLEITGTGFVQPLAVTIGSVAVTEVIVISPTLIKVRIPPFLVNER